MMQEAGHRYRWVLPHAIGGPPESHVEKLIRQLGIQPVVARILAQRLNRSTMPDNGHHTEDLDPFIEDARRFLQPKLNDLHDPALLPGVPSAAERLAQAVRDNQPIVIYGDYDVDGVTAAAILWHTLRLADADVRTYIPHRLDEGYGLNSDAIHNIIDDSPSPPLIVSVDCGITAVQPAWVAKDRGIDLIITDHHHFDLANLPEAYTLVHPALPNTDQSLYPCPHLCGAGVAFKLAWQFARQYAGSDRLPDRFRNLMVDLLSLAALGTVADVVPLIDENRVLTAYGLGRIKQTPIEGLAALIDVSRLRDEKIDAYHVGFVLGPRLNACGRMGHARDALELLTTATGLRATELARFLTSENDKRRATEQRITEQAMRMIEDRGYADPDRRAIVVGGEDWHPGVVGIVASRLVDAYHRPAVVLGYQNGTAQGSARSVDGVSIIEALTTCSSFMDKFGGHAMAAGLTLPVDQVDPFREALIDQVNGMHGEDDLVRRVCVDAEVSVEDCSLDVFDQLSRLAPFGRGNPTPRLLLREAVLTRPAQRMGNGGKHLSMSLTIQGRPLRAVAFGMGDEAPRLPAGVAVDLLFEPKTNTWQGVRRAELHVKDFKIRSTVPT